MKTKKLSWLFGFTDRDCKEMIEEQANTKSKANVQQTNSKPKSLVKTKKTKGPKRLG